MAAGRRREDQRDQIAALVWERFADVLSHQAPGRLRRCDRPLFTIIQREMTVVTQGPRSLAAKALEMGRWLRHRAENICALFLVGIFLSFMIQIIARYVFNYPLGWTDEVSAIFWIWCTLWGAAFVLRERDEVRFDIFYSPLSERTRCVFTVITGVIAIVALTAALPAVY